jgi:isopentenyl diphosphate isomerase/L-lactate dehydrogenase-like FMN-dependent dehydrogenase
MTMQLTGARSIAELDRGLISHPRVPEASETSTAQV